MSWLAPAGQERKCVVRKMLNESVCTQRQDRHSLEERIQLSPYLFGLRFCFPLSYFHSLLKTLSVIFCLWGNMKTNINPSRDLKGGLRGWK